MTRHASITVLVERFPAETFVLRQVQALSVDVAAIVVDRDAQRAADIDTDVASLSGGVDLKGGLCRRAWRRVARMTLGERAPAWPGWVQRNWRHYLQERRPAVVLAQFGPNGMRCLDGCQAEGIPLVVHFHGYDASSLIRSRAYGKRLGDLFEYAAAVVVVSQVMRETLLGLGCPAEKLSVIPCGVPVADFPVSESQANQPCRFLAAGRFVPKKSPLLVLKSFERCAGSCPGVRLTMIGEGPLLAAARRWVKRSDLGDRIELLGNQPNAVVRQHMADSGCFVQHSMTAPDGDTEGWPVATAEAASSGLPVIATRHAGIPEQVIDGETGYLVEEGDWQAMGDRMIELAQDPERRKTMGLAGRWHIEAVGGFKDQVHRLGEVLSSVAGRHESSSRFAESRNDEHPA